MRNAVLGCKLIPSQVPRLMDRVDYPFGVVFSRLDSPVIKPEISTKLKGSLDYITLIPNVLENGIPHPKIRAELPGLLKESIFFYLLATPVQHNKLFLLHEVHCFKEGKLNPVFTKLAIPALVVELTGFI